jgi:hypothetical protein
VNTSPDDPSEDVARYVSPADYVDSDSQEVRTFVTRALRNLPDAASETEKAIHLFEAVRDGLRYDPYTFALTADAYRASRIAGAEACPRPFCWPPACAPSAFLPPSALPMSATI